MKFALRTLTRCFDLAAKEVGGGDAKNGLASTKQRAAF
jgi:hypothetical protein